MTETPKMNYRADLKPELRYKTATPVPQSKNAGGAVKPSISTSNDKQKLVLRLIDYIETI
jgi:hypothetical protein